MTESLLFVCSGNICRSPFAEIYLRKVAAEIRFRGPRVTSAGTLGLRDVPAPDIAVRVARSMGVDLRPHRSRALTEGLMRVSDLVVVMSSDHRRTIEDRWPRQADKVRLLREWEDESTAPRSGDVLDPIGMPEEEYRFCYEIIKRCVLNLAFALKHPE